MTNFSKQYLDYIASPEWQQKRRQIIQQRGYVCQQCGNVDAMIQLHHLTYERLGRELDIDLVLLCKKCHATADSTRRFVAGNQRAANRYHNAMDTYLTKKYGDDRWRWPHNAEEEFDEWLVRKERDKDW